MICDLIAWFEDSFATFFSRISKKKDELITFFYLVILLRGNRRLSKLSIDHFAYLLRLLLGDLFLEDCCCCDGSGSFESPDPQSECSDDTSVVDSYKDNLNC